MARDDPRYLPASHPSRWFSRNLALVSLASLLTDVSSEMVYPIIGIYATTALGAGMLTLGVVEGVAEGLPHLLKVVAGAWSDRLGRWKAFAIGGYVLSALGKALLALAYGASWALAGRVVDRAGKGIRGPARDALIAESAPAESRGRAFGFHRACDNLGAVVGVLIALGIIWWWGRNLPVVLGASLVPAVLAVLVLIGVRERARAGASSHGNSDPGRDGGAPGVGRGVRPRVRGRLRAFLAVATIFSLCNCSNQFFLVRAYELGVPLTGVVLLYLLYNVVAMAGSYAAGSWSDRVGRRTILVLGYVAFGAAYAGFAMMDRIAGPMQVLALAACYGVYGFHGACAESVERALLADLAPEGLRSTVLGLHGTLTGVALIPASILAGWLWQAHGAWAAFVPGAAGAVLAAVSVRVVLR